MSELMMQHEANVASRLRLGMPVLMPSRVVVKPDWLK